MHNTNKIIKSNATIYEYHDGGVLHGYVKCRAADPPAGDPWIAWKGAKIPHAMWQQMLQFLIWTYDTTKPNGADEGMVQLFYNEETNHWLAWAPPQRGFGMTVKTLDDHPNWKQSEAFVGYQLVGTGHHHCSSSAFQSGTDRNDEQQANGLHFTVGNLDKAYVTLHARVVFNGNMRETQLFKWVELADRYRATAQTLPELIPVMSDYSLCSRPKEDVTFPEEWKANYIRTTSSIVPASSSHGQGISAYCPKSYYPTRGAEDKTQAELGEEALEALEKSGLATFAEIVSVCEVMNKHHRDTWNGESEVLGAVDSILKTHGLNPRWLEKWVEIEQQIRTAEAYGYDGSV